MDFRSTWLLDGGSDELEILLLLSPGDSVEARDRQTSHRWRGTVDIVAPEQGKFWMFAELGERKLIDAQVHTIRKVLVTLAATTESESLEPKSFGADPLPR
ncbi:hypothetical protein [Pseudarthrobacter sp. DSP2-3-2b1]|uniref:hypothetical protein n=1 Tax=Pseudarthrobacter sp. DSP2-3-2b1 TaxID=2804661 RepID=UPI003CE87D53